MKLQIRLPYGMLEYTGIIPSVKSDTETDASEEIKKLIKWSSDLECESAQQ